MEKFLFINWNSYNNLEHLKIKNFVNHLQNNTKIEFLNISNNDLKKFIVDNINNPYLLVFPYYIYDKPGGNPYINFYNDMTNIILFINKHIESLKNNEIQMKFIFNTMDVHFGNLQKNYLKLLFNSSILHVIFNIENFDDLKIYSKNEYLLLKNKNIHFLPINYSYYHADFNKTPINKISMGGDKRHYPYPERYNFDKILSKFPDKYIYLEYNASELDNYNFIIRLNKYICSFFSNNIIYYNSGPLMKIFEILSSGSLLLTHYKDKKIMDILGLKINIHYMIIEAEENIFDIITYILNLENRNIINKIRKEGYTYCINNLNYNYLYKRYINI